MKIRIRRVGNSLGVILPKHILDQWGLVEGASVDLTADGVFFDATRAKEVSHEIADGSIWTAKREQQAREITSGQRNVAFSERVAREAIINGSPL